MQNLIATTKLRQTLIDPSVNLVLNQLKKELDENRKVIYPGIFSFNLLFNVYINSILAKRRRLK